MKRLLALLQILLILPIAAVAQEDIDMEPEVTEELELEEPGVTPDSLLWAADIGWDRLRLLFMRNKAKKARFRLLIAQERLAEINAMSDEDLPESLERAQGAYDATVKALGEDIENLDEEGEETTLLEEDLEFETKFEVHLERLRAVRDKVAEKNENAAAAIDAAIEKQERNHELKIERRERIKAKLLERRDDLTEAELNAEIIRLKIKYREHIEDKGIKAKIRKKAADDEEFRIRIKERIKDEIKEEVREEIKEEIRARIDGTDDSGSSDEE